MQKQEQRDTQPEFAPKLTKAQRRAQHLEQQKQLWDSAENPARNHWLESQGVVPLKQEPKQQVKLLSRKPAAPTIANRDVAGGVAGLKLDDDEDSEAERQKKQLSELEERQRKAKIEREEKQKKYAEARERIMGSSNPSSPAPSAPPASRDSSQGRQESRKSKTKLIGYPNSQPTSSADQSPARSANDVKNLFVPDDMGRRMPKRESASVSNDDQPARQPRGPESSGRGGFGFAARGTNAGT